MLDASTDTVPRPGNTISLNWQVENADSMWIDQGVGTVTNNYDDNEGWVLQQPRQTTTYTLSAANRYGTVSAGLTVTVLQGDAANRYDTNDGAGGIAAGGNSDLRNPLRSATARTVLGYDSERRHRSQPGDPDRVPVASEHMAKESQ